MPDAVLFMLQFFVSPILYPTHKWKCIAMTYFCCNKLMMLIQEYQPQWPQDFNALREVLLTALTGFDIAIEHVGSTSVPGLAAKPIIDIDIVYDHPVTLHDITMALAAVGYYHNGDQGISGREAFKRHPALQHPVLGAITHHLYVCRANSTELQRHLLFRNYLRTHPEAVRDYEILKRRIAETVNQDKIEYALLKEVQARAFIEGLIEKSRGERGIGLLDN